MKINYLICCMIFAFNANAINLGKAQGEAVQDVAELLIKDIYKNAKVELSIKSYPSPRLSLMVLNNEIDGEVARIGAYFEKNPTLIKVEPGYYHLVTSAFANKNSKIKIKTSEDLKKFKVGIIRGVFHAKIATEGVKDLMIVNEVEQLFQLLDSGRIDIAVDVSINGASTIKNLKLKNLVNVGNLADREFYNVLAPAQKEIALKLAKAIDLMKKSGELTKLTHKYENQILKN